MGKEYQSEAELETQFMRRLNSIGYQEVHLRSEAEVVEHFRTVLNQRNQENLAGKPLTDSEFTRVLNELVGSRTLFEIAQLLRGSEVQPYGKVVITRDDNRELYLEIFDGRNYRNNVFEVTHQVTVDAKYENRYDVTILINGLPIVQVELKRRGVEFGQAFNQIVRYRDESFRQLYRFVQIFVISSGEETRYFANTDGALNPNFMFYWTDKDNHWLNDIDAFTPAFFDPKRLHSLIAYYTIFDNEKQRMLIMRPYQVFATEAIIDQAIRHPNENGYIWHTTGSGKTITAFKASQLIAQRTDAKKVIFLIDRSDLDLQTAKNFNSYLPKTVNQEPALDRTDSTRTLVKQLQSNDNPLIITTIQKLNHAINSDRYKSVLTPFHDQHVVFIEDEAHRSQFGDMRKSVNHWFKNAQHFGFTGTPIFGENKGPDGRTTDTLYHKCLHQYLIKDAIRDHNVLGFSMQYFNTIKGHEELSDGDKEVTGIDTQEAFESLDRVKAITQHILWKHNQITNNRHYNAILTVSSTDMALKYYDVFKKLDPYQRLNVTTIFTWAANEDRVRSHQERLKDDESEDELTSRHGLERVISDYNKQYHTAFSTDTFKDYFTDVSKRMKSHNDQTPDENIDVLIVVNMFLTGFDSPKLATLYVDKNLQWHGLIQAFSRTNRVETKAKPSGNIIAYRNIKAQTDAAVKLFSQGSDKDFFVPTYEELSEKLNKAISDLHDVTQEPQDVDKLYDLGDEAIEKFVLAFREVLRIHNKIRVYDEFEWRKVPNFTAQDMESFRGKYYTAYQQLKPDNNGSSDSILNDIDFEVSLLTTDEINVQYITNLIKTISLDSEKNREADTRKIKRLINNADNKQLKLKSELLLKFLDEIVPKLAIDANVAQALNQYMAEEREASIKQFASQVKLPEDILREQIDNFGFYGHTITSQVTEALINSGQSLLKASKARKEIESFVAENQEKYELS